MGLVIIFTTLISFASQSTCPPTKELPNLPVHDQDGLGTCASNTAALMIQHNLRLAESPSYFQLSLTTSGHKKSDFFFTDSKGNEQVFNWGEYICDVVKSAKRNGFCSHSTFERDAIGTTDPQWTQQKFLLDLSRFIQMNQGDIGDIVRNLRDTELQRQAREKLALHFLNRSVICQESFPDFVVRRGLERFKEWLTPKITEGNITQQVSHEHLWKSTFNPDGTPQRQAETFYRNFLFQKAGNFLESSNGVTPFNSSLLPEEKVFGETYLQALGIGNITFDYPSMFQSDYDAYSICRGNDVISGGQLLLNNSPMCLNTPQNEGFNTFLAQADQLIQGLLSYSTPRLDPQAGLVNLISPRCAVQMAANKNNPALNCRDTSINNDASARRAKNTIQSELCNGRAVAISMCTGFFKAENPISTNYCKDEVEGVENHGRHALTLVGYRSVNGKKQIKIQNSWGPQCPFMQNDANAIPSGLVDFTECELDAEGVPTGRFWVDEDLLINNTYRFSVMP